MQLATVSTGFAEYCRQHQRHPSCREAVNLIGVDVEVISGSEFIATGNGGGEPWVRVRGTVGGETIELAIPQKYLRYKPTAVSVT